MQAAVVSAAAEPIVARFADVAIKQYVTVEEAVELSQVLGERIARLSPPPDLIVGLTNGGILPAAVAAQVARIDCRMIRIRRKSSRIKRKFQILARMLRYSSSSLGGILVRLVRSRIDRPFNQIEDGPANEDYDFPIAGQHIVIVDDCVDSGSSAAHVRAKLLGHGAASVRVAVMCWATKFDSQALHGVVPDVHLHRILHRYPWSMNNPQYPRFRQWANAAGYRLWK
jgi:hypoxanthine phosphoribosyltransferase